VPFLALVPTHRIMLLGLDAELIDALLEAVPEGFIGAVGAEAAIQKLRRRDAPAVERGTLDLIEGTVARIPYRDHYFDRALVYRGFEEWPSPVDGLREMRRILGPGGSVVVAMHPVDPRLLRKHPERYNEVARAADPKSSILEAMEQAGFARRSIGEDLFAVGHAPFTLD